MVGQPKRQTVPSFPKERCEEGAFGPSGPWGLQGTRPPSPSCRGSFVTQHPQAELDRPVFWSPAQSISPPQPLYLQLHRIPAMQPLQLRGCGAHWAHLGSQPSLWGLDLIPAEIRGKSVHWYSWHESTAEVTNFNNTGSFLRVRFHPPHNTRGVITHPCLKLPDAS